MGQGLIINRFARLSRVNETIVRSHKKWYSCYGHVNKSAWVKYRWSADTVEIASATLSARSVYNVTERFIGQGHRFHYKILSPRGIIYYHVLIFTKLVKIINAPAFLII
jgi:hypothetical protein